MKLLAATLAFLAPSLLVAQGDVHVVDDDPGPGVDFTDLQPAIDAAGQGDLVLVREGFYAPFTLTKGLAIVGEVGAAVVVLGVAGDHLTLVTGVPAGASARLRGLRFRPPETVDGDTLRLAQNAGEVWLEDVHLEFVFPAPFVYTLNQVQALRVEDCARVVLARSSVAGLDGAPPGNGLETGSRAIASVDSTLHVLDSDVAPGATLVLGDFGREALVVDGGLLTLRDARVTGGPGGCAGPFGSPSPGMGGPAVELAGGAVVWSIGSEVEGGPGGGNSFGANGPPGVPFEVLSGTVNEHAASAVRLAAPALVRDDATVTVTVAAEPGSPCFLLLTPTPDPLFLALFPGVLVSLTPNLLSLGTTDGAGQLAFTSPIPPLPAAVGFRARGLQALALTPTTGLELSNVSLLHLVQESF